MRKSFTVDQTLYKIKAVSKNNTEERKVNLHTGGKFPFYKSVLLSKTFITVTKETNYQSDSVLTVLSGIVQSNNKQNI